VSAVTARERAQRYSMRGRLLAWLLSALVVAGLMMGYAAYRRAHQDLDDLLDYQLQQLAFSLSRQSVASVPLPPGMPSPEPDFITQVWDRDGVLMFYSRPNLAIPMRPRPGFTNMDWNGQSWRVFTQLDGARIIQVAHPLSLRREMAADFARRAVLPLLALLPLLAIVIWVVVGRALTPLSSISAALRARTPAALEPLPQEKVPEELVPLVGSLNDLLQRLQHALEVQRQFVGDAAHELRSPLTAVQLQLSLLKRASGEDERAAAIERLERGVHRSNRLVQQLLTLARQDPQAPDAAIEDVDIGQLAHELATDYEPQAALERQSLRLESAAEPVLVRGEREALRVMLSNLIDNALRYTPADGSVAVRISRAGDEALIEVEDSGPGIAPEQRARVFDRFYRVPRAAAEEGSGLGLAIVKRVLDRHAGSVSLDDASAGSGLKVSVRLPVVQSVQHG
jgi:two-component system, OmpR family, sensor kinase